MSHRAVTGAWLALAALAAPMSAQQRVVQMMPVGSSTVVPAPVPATSYAALHPGDMLRLRIWREPDFSGDYLVDETGRAVLPRLGRTTVTGVPTDRLKEQLETQYREYLNNPTIEITPLRQIAILGGVRNPGMYRVEPSVTLGDAVNVAGGPTSNSRSNVVELRRAAEKRTIDFEKHPELASLPLDSSDQVFVPEKSWLRQNATWFVSTLVGVLGTTALLLTR